MANVRDMIEAIHVINIDLDRRDEDEKKEKPKGEPKKPLNVNPIDVNLKPLKLEKIKLDPLKGKFEVKGIDSISKSINQLTELAIKTSKNNMSEEQSNRQIIIINAITELTKAISELKEESEERESEIVQIKVIRDENGLINKAIFSSLENDEEQPMGTFE